MQGRPAPADSIPTRLVVNAYSTAYARFRTQVLEPGADAVGLEFA